MISDEISHNNAQEFKKPKQEKVVFNFDMRKRDFVWFTKLTKLFFKRCENGVLWKLVI